MRSPFLASVKLWERQIITRPKFVGEGEDLGIPIRLLDKKYED